MWNILHVRRPPTPPLPDTHASTVPDRLWFTAHFTPSWGGHLQCWPCTAPQGRRRSIWQQLPPKNPRSTGGNFAVNLIRLWAFLLWWLEGLEMHLSHRSVPSLPPRLYSKAGLHCTTPGETVAAHIYNASPWRKLWVAVITVDVKLLVNKLKKQVKEFFTDACFEKSVQYVSDLWQHSGVCGSYCQLTARASDPGLSSVRGIYAYESLSGVWVCFLQVLPPTIQNPASLGWLRLNTCESERRLSPAFWYKLGTHFPIKLFSCWSNWQLVKSCFRISAPPTPETVMNGIKKKERMK